MSGKLGFAGRNAPDPGDPASGMCDPCRDKFKKLSDTERPCDRPGCSGTWTWPLLAQLEAFASKRPAPTNLCADCEARLASLEDKPVACAVASCRRTSLFSRRAQLLAGAPDVELTPTPTRCSQCEGVYKKLKDRQVSCGINGCKHKWLWTADEQIEAYAAGKPNEPPRRMCDECKTVFGGIADREVRCRTSGCKKTWVWSRGDQLDACISGKPAPKAPHRMCPSCLDIYSRLKDVERACRRAGCKRTWTDKRGGQLARAVRGKTGDPYPHYCTECEKEMGELEDRQIACKTDHCTGTWTWTKAQQLAAGVHPVIREEAGELAVGGATADAPVVNAEGAAIVAPGAAAETAAVTTGPTPTGGARGRGHGSRRNRKKRREPRPPERRCEACIEFLKDRKTREIPCKVCNTPIYWPPESQLQTHLGNWAEPAMCGACKRDVTEAARIAQREALRHPPLPGHESGAPSGGPIEGGPGSDGAAATDAQTASPPSDSSEQSPPAVSS